MFHVNRIRNYRRNWRKLSPGQKDEFRLNLLVVFAMTPFLFYMALLPIFLPDTAISEVSAIMLGVLVPVTGMAARIKLKDVRTLSVAVGFIGISLSAFSLVQSKMETAFNILSRDVTTLDFKLAGMVFATAVTLTAIGLIHDRRVREDPQTDPRRYT